MKHELKYIRTDKNGTKIYHDFTCKRCGGAGASNAWALTGYTCYECGGKGITPFNPQVIKVYTPEYEEKLKAQREKRAAQREAELKAQAEAERQEWIKDHFPEGKIYVFVGDTYKIHNDLKADGATYTRNTGWYFKHAQDKYPTIEMSFEESTHENCAGFMRINGDVYEKAKAKADALKPKSEYVGTAGEKLTIKATYTHSAWFESQSRYTYCTEKTYIHHFETDKGEVLIWKTGIGVLPVDEGEKAIITGTVKEHSEYKGIKQTVLTRCKVEKES